LLIAARYAKRAAINMPGGSGIITALFQWLWVPDAGTMETPWARPD
jgi:hypothetical protein